MNTAVKVGVIHSFSLFTPIKLLPIRPFALTPLAPTLVGGLLLSACSSNPTATEASQTATVVDSTTNAASDSAVVTAAAPGEVKPTGPAPAWGPNIKPEMLAVIEQLQSFNPKPFSELTSAQARKQPGATEAVQKQMCVSNLSRRNEAVTQ